MYMSQSLIYTYVAQLEEKIIEFNKAPIILLQFLHNNIYSRYFTDKLWIQVFLDY